MSLLGPGIHRWWTCTGGIEPGRPVCVRRGDAGIRGAPSEDIAATLITGGPEPVHDVDFVVAEPCADAAAATLESAGFRVERTPEAWLFKAHDGDVVVDVLHRLNGVPIEAEEIEAADEIEVLAVKTRVLSATRVVTEKLASLNEHHCDFASFLPGVRAVREQVDWDRVRSAASEQRLRRGVPGADGPTGNHCLDGRAMKPLSDDPDRLGHFGRVEDLEVDAHYRQVHHDGLGLVATRGDHACVGPSGSTVAEPGEKCCDHHSYGAKYRTFATYR